MQHAKKPYFPDFCWILTKQCYLMKSSLKMRNFFKIIVYFFLFSLLVSCGKGFFKKVDTRKVPISGPERAKQNVKEGRGVGLGKMMGRNRFY